MNDAFLWAEEDAPVADVEEWAILMSLSKRADPDGCNAYQSYPTIAKRSRVDPKTVYRRVKEMESRGILVRGDQSVVAHIKADKRPVVWDIQIPYSWFPNVKRINQWRAEHGKGPLTPEMRPDLAPAPERKRRKDAGMPRRKKSVPSEGTSSPVADGLQVQPSESGETDGTHGLQDRPDYESSRGGTTSPTTSLGVEVLSKGTVRTSSPPTPSAADVEPSPPVAAEDPEEKTAIPSEIKNQETQADVESKDFFPTLTGWEAELLAECRALDPLWTSSKLTKVLGSRTVREVTARNPELVRRAFLIGARDPGTTTPMRLWWVEKCPHWRTALAQLTAEAAAAASPGDDVPPTSGPTSDPAPVKPEQVDAPRPVPSVPEQRAAARVAPVSPAAPTAEYLARKAALAKQTAARREAEERAERARRERLEATLSAVIGDPARVTVGGDPVLDAVSAQVGEVVPAG